MSVLITQDIEQMLRLFNIEVNRSDQGDGALFIVPQFGVQVVFNIPHFNLDTKNWWVVIIDPFDDLETKRLETLWQLVRGGYFHYIRTEYPNTYKKMFTMFNYDKQLIDERLKLFGDKPKYNYFKRINSLFKDKSSLFVMATDPGFYDFLQEG